MENRELMHLLLDKVLDVQEKTEHFADLEFSNFGTNIQIRVMEGGFSIEKDYALEENFSVTKLKGSKRLQRTLEYLDSLIPGGQPI